ncbi:16S rRNA (cytosine(1402)-N(4))-methyltransferase RsmH [Nodosilinea sp. LEGE 06152]|uniref:16S rRNA (cytosine(1402)-N(4))-methyltransferase RsmH n=1 Tax=Nodosilinea sp. LEGE 06152 TaxID=2777966 RepID=UPI0018825B9C|nr:16S rRNA (cytosine(1402)-N(4))-methyltransferase RsmH [Nodosilinea sp. LEGE 06152]MBE9156607.1 16S rRNA (cytosine(1402)-N(4))-methyltransferase RsmH [Nodosilinea sp. LEGE 06152]
MAEPEFHHVPVLPDAVTEGLSIQPGGRYLDATAGGGGHSRLILEADPTVSLVAVDQDAAAIAATQANLAEFAGRVSYWHGNFAEFKPSGAPFSGILADLGVSSVQLDVGDRGFSFRQSAPLDMRMDLRQDLTAADIVNHWDETELANLIYTYGEERLSRRIARKIVDQRPWQTTTDLAEAISYSVPRSYRYGRIHPATRTFQALRIAVNRELEVLETLLKVAPTWLAPGGRLVIISFHSLEDRLVKHTLKDSPDLKVITKKPVIATEAELSQNPRSRSAKLRVAERIVAL